MKKDWTGNKNSVFKTLGASNHTDKERQHEDYYATDPIAAKLLLEVETFNKNVWECACGEKHLSKVFENAGYNVRSSDIIDRCENEVFDFLSIENKKWDGDIITNPPYKYAVDFIYKALQIIPTGNKIAMFLKVQFLEGRNVKDYFKHFHQRLFMFLQAEYCVLRMPSLIKCVNVEVPLYLMLGICGKKDIKVTLL